MGGNPAGAGLAGTGVLDAAQSTAYGLDRYPDRQCVVVRLARPEPRGTGVSLAYVQRNGSYACGWIRRRGSHPAGGGSGGASDSGEYGLAEAE